MAKKKESYTLKFGHSTSFRRTVRTGTRAKPKSVVLVFEPGLHYELSEREVEGVQHEIEVGLLVPSNYDPKGRHKDPRPASVEANEVIAELEKKVEDQAATISDQAAMLETLLDAFDEDPEEETDATTDSE